MSRTYYVRFDISWNNIYVVKDGHIVSLEDGVSFGPVPQSWIRACYALSREEILRQMKERRYIGVYDYTYYRILKVEEMYEAILSIDSEESTDSFDGKNLLDDTL